MVASTLAQVSFAFFASVFRPDVTLSRIKQTSLAALGVTKGDTKGANLLLTDLYISTGAGDQILKVSCHIILFTYSFLSFATSLLLVVYNISC